MPDQTAPQPETDTGSRKVIYAAILANLGIAAAKFVVALLSGSAAMMAEGIHSASIGVGLLLIGAACALARETGGLLVGEGIGREQTGHLRNIFYGDPSIDTVGRLLTMQLGPDEVLLTAAVQFKRGMRIDEVEKAIERLEARVHAAYPSVQHIYFESAGLRSGMR